MYFIDKALRKKHGIMICCVNNFQGPEILKGGSADGKSSKSIVNPDRNLHFSLANFNFEFWICKPGYVRFVKFKLFAHFLFL